MATSFHKELFALRPLDSIVFTGPGVFSWHNSQPVILLVQEMGDPNEKKSDSGVEEAEFRHVELVVDRFQAGRRMDLLLTARYPALSRSSWQQRINDGEVTLNEKPTRPSRVVHEGEVIRFSYRMRPEPDVDRNIGIIYEDDDLLVIDKPGDLPIHASGGYRKNTLNEVLIELFRSRGQEDFVCRPAHRLDRETSGLIVYTKSTQMARKVTKAFLSGEVDKYYTVFVFGSFAKARSCEGWIGPDGGSTVRRKQRYHEGEPGPDDVRCRTDFERIQEVTIDGRLITALKARLFTGRMHQIRATLCSLGYPVVGDRLYGPDETIYLRRLEDAETEADARTLLLKRTALHCTRIEFRHPRTGQRLLLESPLPDSLATLLTPDASQDS
jgi:RluA family pseudouridine synthase